MFLFYSVFRILLSSASGDVCSHRQPSAVMLVEFQQPVLSKLVIGGPVVA